MSLMRGPMTRNDIVKARQWRARLQGVELPPNSVARPNLVIDIPENIPKPKLYGFADAVLERLERAGHAQDVLQATSLSRAGLRLEGPVIEATTTSTSR